MKAYRFGVSWSALNPAKGKFDSEYLQNYVTICKKLKDNGIEPFVTLCHFEIPAWLEELGGFTCNEFPEYFRQFAEFVVEGLKDVCKSWFTVNEPAVYPMLGYLSKEFPPGKSDFKLSLKCLSNNMKAHAIAYKIIHEKIPGARASFAKQIMGFEPIHRWSALECIICYVGNSYFNFPVMNSILTGSLTMSFFGYKVLDEKIEGLKDSLDFIGINHYTVIFASLFPKDWSGRSECPILLSNYTRKFELSQIKWTLVPSSLAQAVEWVHNKWNPRKIPIVISEHGISDKSDLQRQWYVPQTLAHLSKVIQEKHIPVTHYLHWSLIDNYEWAHGYTQNFGLISFDSETQERHQRESCNFIKEVAKQTK